MGVLLLLTHEVASPAVLPSLALLGHSHTVRTGPPTATALLHPQTVDAVLVDARVDLVAARGLCRLLRTTGMGVPLVAVVTEGGLAAVNGEWGVDDVVLSSAGPAEVEARLRLVLSRHGANAPEREEIIRSGDLVVDESTYSARVRGRMLDLTYKEFELLKHLAQHPGRVYTREQLLQEVWGYDYYGGTRTVDVHVRRLRAKLGAEHESLIGTVRHVGYKFVSQPVQVLPGEPGEPEPALPAAPTAASSGG